MFSTRPSHTTISLAEVLFLGVLLIAGGLLAYLDHQWQMGTILLEYVHAAIITIVFISCLVAQMRFPEIKRFGWSQIFVGILLLMIAAWTDILDNYDITLLGIPFGHSWQQAYIEKIMGYTVGVALIAVGFSRWIPWMVQTRRRVEILNRELTSLITSFDERVESERLTISRELHDDVAQQLTYLTFQTQILETKASDPEALKPALQQFSTEVSDTLKTVRRISQNLRPESLFALGLHDALRQFINKQRVQAPAFRITYTPLPMNDNAPGSRLEDHVSEENLLHIFRLVQESIRNAIKHSHGHHIDVMFREEADAFVFTVSDDGKGLRWEEMPENDQLVEQGHLGIAGMRERAAALEGTYTIQNRYNEKQHILGSLVTIRIPK